MLLKIEEDSQFHLIETVGPILYGTSAQRSLRKLQSREGRSFQTRPSRSTVDRVDSWAECKPKSVWLSMEDWCADGTHYYAWAEYTDPLDGRTKLVVFSKGYLMNDNGKTIETIK